MKKCLKISGFVVGGLLIVLTILPFAFKGKLETMVMKQANASLNAKLSFRDLSLNLFQDFPNLRASMQDFTIVGVDSFAHDTLIRASSAQMTINLKSVFSESGYQISTMRVKDAQVYIKTLASGQSNYDIVKPDTAVAVNEPADTSVMRFQLEKVMLKNVDITYDNRSAEVYVVCKKTDAELKGLLSTARTTLTTELTVDKLSYKQFGFPVLVDVKAKGNVALDADLENWLFTFRKNTFLLNDLPLAFDGSIGLPGNNISFDIKAVTPTVTFKQLLSIIPAFYTDDYSDLKADGRLDLSFYMKGLMTDELWPSFGFKLQVENGSIQYPALPKSIRDIGIALAIDNPGCTLDGTQVALKKFHLSMDGNPFDVTASVIHPTSDPAFQAAINGTLNLSTIKDVYPLPENTNLQGVFKASLAADGRMSYVNQKQYEMFRVNGTLGVSGIKLSLKDLPELLVHQGNLTFSSRSATLSNLALNIGKNDLKLNGSLSNYLGWYLHDEVLSGMLSIQSNLLDVGNLMSLMSSGQSKPAETSGTDAAKETPATPSGSDVKAVEVPKNLDLTLQATGKRILFNALDLSDAHALLLVKQGRVTVKDLSAKALGGMLAANGYYETSNPNKPVADFGLNLKDVSYGKTFTTFEFVRKLAPIFENITGTYSMKLNLNTLLDGTMSPDLKAMTGLGALTSSNLGVSKVKVVDALATSLKMDKLKNLTLKDLAASFTIKDGNVTTKPFTVNVAGVGLTLGGVTGLDKHIQYDVKVVLPSKLAFAGAGELTGTIGGTFDKPVVRFNTASVAKKAAEQAADKVLQKAIGSNVAETKAKIQQELDKKAALLRAEAKSAGDALIAQAEARGNDLIDKAKNPILKAAAKTTAAQLKKEAEKKASELIQKAEREIQQKAAEAQAKAE